MNYKKLSLIHPTCNPNVRNAALSFSEAGLLHEVITTIGYSSRSLLINNLPFGISEIFKTYMSGRVWHLNEESTLRLHPLNELIRLVNNKIKTYFDLGFNSNSLTDWVYSTLSEHAANNHLNNISAIYAYEDGAAEVFKKAKSRDIKCFYDLPIMFYQTVQRILSHEAELYPELAPALKAINEPDWKLNRKIQEVELADHIFVASSITKHSLIENGVNNNKISVVPYGAPLEYYKEKKKNNNKFTVLFVGRVGPRKGVHYLLNAWKQLNLPDSELVIIGMNEFPKGWLEKYSELFTYIPYVPHSNLDKYYQNADILILPSLVEGFGLVLLEAMACGLPIMATLNTAAPDIIEDGKEGFLLPVRDIEKIKEKLEWSYSNRDDLLQMGEFARKRAEKITWEKYRTEISLKLKGLLNLT